MYERARTIRERLVRESPSVTAFQSDLAKNLNDIGGLQHRTGRRADALVSYEETRAIWERLVKRTRRLLRSTEAWPGAITTSAS